MGVTLLDICFSIGVLVLTASGLVVIFGLMKVVNFAHGEAMMLGAYVALATQEWGSFLLSVVAASIAVALLGLVVERLIVRRLYRRALDAILATWGLGLLIRELVRIFQDRGYNSLPAPIEGPVQILGVAYSGYRLVIILTAAALLVSLWAVERYTRLGSLVRGVIADPELARALGVNVDRVYLVTFAGGWMLAGLAGALLAPLVTITPAMGANFLTGGFLTTILAGVTLAGLGPAAALLGVTNGAVAAIFDAVTASLAVLAVAMVAMRYKGQRAGR